MCRNCFGRWSSNLYISPNDVILPGSPPRGNIKGRANHHSPSSRFPTGQQQDKPSNMTEHILFSLPPSCRIDQPTWESTFCLFASILASSRTDRLSPLSPQSSPLSTRRRAHPIYGPLVSGKSFFHHSSFLINQRILGETNWIFQLLFWLQRFNSWPDDSISIPVLTSAF